MRKDFRIFIIQGVITLAIVFGVSSIIKSLFWADSNAQSYITFGGGVKDMAESATVLIDSLIAKNDLTFDPSSGKLMDKVLKNLKYAEGNKLLIIGSSQMRVVQGEDILSSYQKLASRKIADYTKYNTYNLSIGGMKTSEKLIVAEKGVQILQTTQILISATPWDCLINEVRPSIKEIEKENYLPSKNNNGTILPNKNFPLNVNDKITAIIGKIVEENIDVYSKRTAIKQWLGATMEGTPTEKMKLPNEMEKDRSPDYWRTLFQKLDNISGWDHTVSRTGSGSLKIVNTDSTSAKWFGEDIVLGKATDMLEFSGWSKAENATSTKLYCLNFQVFFEDGTSEWYFRHLRFRPGTHDWERVGTKVQFDKKVTKIKPHALFYGATGTVWFDDLEARPIYGEVKGENILPNPSFENELKERPHVSYTYNTSEWEQIEKNMLLVIDFLSEHGTTNQKQNIFLLTPFWHKEEKTAYPQKEEYKKLVTNVKQYCMKKNVAFIDASYILTKDNFGIYTQGSVRDKIDVLHFDAEAHDKLAKYIIKELNL